MPKTAEDRKVIYPKLVTEALVGKSELTAEQARELVGWREMAEGEKGYPLLELGDKRIACDRVNRQRPYYAEAAESYKQEILNKRWRANGETIVFSKYGDDIDGKHRLIALILADISMQQDTLGHWKELWEGKPVSMPCILIKGIEDDDATVNTINTGKARSVGDMLYIRESMASTYKDPKKRKAAAAALGNAVMFLWDRTGAKEDPYSPRRTHSELVDTLDRHPSLEKDALKHVLGEDGDGLLSKYVSRGIAAGSLYLMGASATDPEKYMEDRKERRLDKANWDRARQFIVDLLSSKAMLPLRTALERLQDADPEKIATGHEDAKWGGTAVERFAVLCIAWNKYVHKKRIDDADFLPLKEGEEIVDNRLHYRKNEYNVWKLDSRHSFGGIDRGVGAEPPKPVPVEVQQEEEPAKPTQEQIEGEQLAKLRAQYPGKVFLFKSNTGGFFAQGDDAAVLAAALDIRNKIKDGVVPKLLLPKEALTKRGDGPDPIETLRAAKCHVVVFHFAKVGPNKELQIQHELVS